MLKKRSSLHILTVAAVTVIAGWAEFGGASWFQRLELSVEDALLRFGRPAAVDPQLVFLARDTASASLETADLEQLFDLRDADAASRRALELMTHEWPWSRDVYPVMLDRLVGAGARAVVFDFTFIKATPQDDAFRNSLERHRDRVVVAGNITEELDGNASVFTAPTESLIPQTSPRDSRIGFDNFWPDADGIVRSAQYRWALQSGVWQASEEFSLAARVLQKAGADNAVPTDRESYRLRLSGPPGTYRVNSIYEIFVPKYWKRNYANGAFFKDKIVIIGASGNWQHDDHQTALGMMAGAEIQLNAINAALHHEFLRLAPWHASLALCIFAGVGALGCCLYRSSPVLHLGLILGSSLAWVGAALLLFNKPGVLIPVVAPLSILSLAGLFTLSYDLVSFGTERLRLRRTIVERKRAQELLESANEELERRVAERTTALTEANATLAEQSGELSRANATLTGLLDEKIVLLKEVHHRVKNNLQIISSLLNLQSGYIQDSVALRCFNESRHRVHSMALIHEKLYQSDDLAKVDFQDYLRTLVGGLQASFAGNSSEVQMSVEAEDILLGVDSAVPCGLIVNELVTNCFKYAFANGAGEIRISMKRAPDSRLQLIVSDDGIGFPKHLDIRNTESLGMQVVTTLTDQLEGTIALRNGCGTTFEISFPESNPARS